MTSLIILLIIVAVYVYLRRINPPDEIRAYEYPVSNGKTGVNSVADIASLLHSRGERLRGLGHADIDHLKETFKTELPFSYCQFLFYMGKGAGRFMMGSSVFIDELYDLREGTKALCEENGLPDIPENAFVFWMHQGYQALYFIPEEGVDDPDIYYYTECANKKGFEKTGHSFIYFLKIELVRIYPELEEELLSQTIKPL